MKILLRLSFLLVALVAFISPRSVMGSFSDVPVSHLYYDSIQLLVDEGVVQGYPDGTYRPADILNRAEMTKILAESTVSDSSIFNSYRSQSCFPDVNPGAWYTQYVCYAKAQGWVRGYTDGTFRPSRDVSHVEALKIAFKAYQISFDENQTPWYADLLKKAQSNQYLAPTYSEPNQPLNRGEMASMTTRIVDFESAVTPVVSSPAPSPTSTSITTPTPNPAAPAPISTPTQSVGTPDPTYCGNGEIDPYEVCDGSMLGSETCNSTCTGYQSSPEPVAQVPPTSTTPPSSYQPISLVTSGMDNPSSCNVGSYGLTGSTYYFCDCGSGSDSDCKAGDTNLSTSTNPLAPARSISSAVAQFNSMPAGSTVALCRGGAFDTTTLQLFNQSCQAGSRCRLTDYTPDWASGGEKRPIVNTTETGLAFENGGDSIQDGGYVVTNIEVHQSANNANSFGVFLYNDVDDLYLCNLAVDGYGVNVHVAGSSPTIVSGNGDSERVALVHSEILNGQNQGWLGACDDCVIESNYFQNNGWNPPSGGAFSHSIYLGGGTEQNPVTNMLVRANTILNSVDDTNNPGGCEGTILVVHGNHDGLVIENNTIKEAQGTAYQACWGISVTKAYSTPESFRNIKIQNNTVEYVGNQSVIVDPSCTNCTIQNNSILYNNSYFN